jgi:hypothetical protein
VSLCSHYQGKDQIDRQVAFIRDNFLVIGYSAWVGFKQMGAGAILCDIQIPPIGTELRLQPWNFTSTFLSSQYLVDYLRPLKIPFAASLIRRSAEYNPRQEIVLIIQFGASVEIVLLTNLPTSPPASYQLVLDRWDEFMVDDLPFIISDCWQIPSLNIDPEGNIPCTNIALPTTKGEINSDRFQPLKDWLEILKWLTQWRPKNSL